MTGKMTLAVHDDVHHQNADGIEYDLWRINNTTNRVNIKHDRITNNDPHLLVQANTEEDLGSYEIILYIKDYFEGFDQNVDVPHSRFILPFGMNQLDRDYHLNVHITPTSYTCTL
jgi:5-hydroxyisourate hydrolase-like protein (transthyretin family)